MLNADGQVEKGRYRFTEMLYKLPDLRLMTRAARLYHEEGLNQTEVAHRLGLTQVAVSRLLKKAEKHGIAMVPAPHYSLADFRDFRQVMLKEGVTPLGQIIYNSGVIFCAPHRPDVQAVFESTLVLAKKYRDQVWSDQTYLSLAIELQGFNPYTLSPSFNYRAFGELISGSIRIWHSYEPLPPNAGSLEKGYLHRYEKGKLVKAVKVPL